MNTYALCFVAPGWMGRPRRATRRDSPFTATSSAPSAFGTFALANQMNVVKAPKEAPLERLGPLGCGILLRQAIDSAGVAEVGGIVGAAPLGAEAKFDVNDVMIPGKTIRESCRARASRSCSSRASWSFICKGFPVRQAHSIHAVDSHSACASRTPALQQRLGEFMSWRTT